MIKIILFATVFSALALSGVASYANAAAPVPCEDMIKTLDEVLKTSKLSDADTKVVVDLRAKADERCKAEDDRRADEFVDQAMKLVVKK